MSESESDSDLEINSVRPGAKRQKCADASSAPQKECANPPRANLDLESSDIKDSSGVSNASSSQELVEKEEQATPSKRGGNKRGLSAIKLKIKAANDEKVRTASLDELFWLKGYWGQSYVKVPCRVIRNISQLSDMTRADLQEFRVLKGSPKTYLAAVFWDRNKEEGDTINFERKPIANFEHFVPFDKTYTENLAHLYEQPKKGKKRKKRKLNAKEKRVKNNLASMLRDFIEIHGAALDRANASNSENAEADRIAALEKAEAEQERIRAEANPSARSIPRLPKAVSTKSKWPLCAGDLLLVWDNHSRERVKVKATKVDTSKDFPIHLECLVGGSYMLPKETKVARFLTSDEARQALAKQSPEECEEETEEETGARVETGQDDKTSQAFDENTEYITEMARLVDFEMMNGEIEGAGFDSLFSRSVQDTEKHIKEKFGL